MRAFMHRQLETRMDDPVANARRLGPATVLVVDDEPLITATVGDHLRDIGLKVLLAYDGEEAIKILRGTEPVHIVFTDVLMPRLDGFELLRWIRTNRPRIKVLLASGVENVKAASGYVGSPRWLVFKPYGLDDVEGRIRDLLAESDDRPQ
jgi:DNA-binding response OmpR family regulator